jgi:hypothetical protein
MATPMAGGAADLHDDLARFTHGPEALELQANQPLAFDELAGRWATATSKTSLARSTAIRRLHLRAAPLVRGSRLSRYHWSLPVREESIPSVKGHNAAVTSCSVQVESGRGCDP